MHPMRSPYPRESLIRFLEKILSVISRCIVCLCTIHRARIPGLVVRDVRCPSPDLRIVFVLGNSQDTVANTYRETSSSAATYLGAKGLAAPWCSSRTIDRRHVGTLRVVLSHSFQRSLVVHLDTGYLPYAQRLPTTTIAGNRITV